MPKHEPEEEDPLELNGIVVPGDADSDDRQAEAMIEEFLMMGYSTEALLGLFRSPEYMGMNRLWRAYGEAWVLGKIGAVAGQWSPVEGGDDA